VWEQWPPCAERVAHDPQDLDAPLRIAAQRKINSYRQQYADNQNISFLPMIVSTSTRTQGEFCVFLCYRPTGRQRLRRTSLPRECHRNATRTSSFFAERPPNRAGRARSDYSRRPIGGVADQPQDRRLWRSRTPNARSPASPPHSFTQSPFPAPSLVRDGQTSPHKPRLVVSDSTCPPLSSSPLRTAL
jgi:hypothetical protein